MHNEALLVTAYVCGEIRKILPNYHKRYSLTSSLGTFSFQTQTTHAISQECIDRPRWWLSYLFNSLKKKQFFFFFFFLPFVTRYGFIQLYIIHLKGKYEGYNSTKYLRALQLGGDCRKPHQIILNGFRNIAIWNLIFNIQEDWIQAASLIFMIILVKF